MKPITTWAKRLWGVSAAVTALRLILAVFTPLSPQETYYWVYSLHPALSYYDHPPLAAYTILFFTRLFGHTGPAVRLGPVLYALGASWLVYLIGKRLFHEKIGFWAAVLLNLLPTFSLTALFMTPDCPLLFFWCLAVFGALKAVQDNRLALYLPAGLSLGLALLSKYTAVFLPFSLFLFLFLSPAHRFHLKRWEPYAGLLLALTVFSPVLIWNARNDWVSFAFQSVERAGTVKGVQVDEFFGFLASQTGILTPPVFVGMIWALGLGIKRAVRQPSWPETLLLALSLPLVLFFGTVALFEWVKINWLIPAYPPVVLLMTAYFQKGWLIRKKDKVLNRVVWGTAILFFLLLHSAPFLPQIPLSGSTDTLTGWPELAAHLERIQREHAGFGDQRPFVFAWGHKTASELQFYLKGRPETYAQNVLGKKALAYDYWFDPRPLIGRDALFVWSELDPFPDEKSGLLEQFFKRVEPLEPFTVYRGKTPLRTFRISRCYHYLGPEGKKG